MAILKRQASAHWQGTGTEGKGTLTGPSGVLSETPYSAQSRFQNEDGKAGTNPEELVAAAHAGCFTMALSFQLSGAGYTPAALDTTAVVQMEKEEIGWTVKAITLKLKGDVPGCPPEEFKKLAEQAKAGCPISRLLGSVPISLEVNQ